MLCSKFCIVSDIFCRKLRLQQFPAILCTSSLNTKLSVSSWSAKLTKTSNASSVTLILLMTAVRTREHESSKIDVVAKIILFQGVNFFSISKAPWTGRLCLCAYVYLCEGMTLQKESKYNKQNTSTSTKETEQLE